MVKPGGLDCHRPGTGFTKWLSRALPWTTSPGEVEQLGTNKTAGTDLPAEPHTTSIGERLRWALDGGPPNNTLGRADLALWLMSEIGRRNGIVFLRQEFRDDHSASDAEDLLGTSDEQ